MMMIQKSPKLVPGLYNLFHAQLISTEHEFQLPITNKVLILKTCFPTLKCSIVFIRLIIVNMPTTVGMLTFMSMIKFNVHV